MAAKPQHFLFYYPSPSFWAQPALEVGDLLAHPPHIDALWPLLMGALVAYASGVFAIRWLLACSVAAFCTLCLLLLLIGLMGLAYFGK